MTKRPLLGGTSRPCPSQPELFITSINIFCKPNYDKSIEKLFAYPVKFKALGFGRRSCFMQFLKRANIGKEPTGVVE
jgi:hypothetical protein